MPADSDAAAGLMTTKELATYLRLNERTVLKLASGGEIPGVRLGTQWRFQRSVIDAWLEDRMLGFHGGQGRSLTLFDPATFSLCDCFAPEHIVLQVTSASVSGVLQELATRAAALGLVRDRTWFLGALVERENTLTSAVGSGVAFPHTLQRHPEQVVRPFLLLARSVPGIDFPSSDRIPVRILVVMGLMYDNLHLPWLTRLSSVLRQQDVQRDIVAASTERDVFAAVERYVTV